jgi:hypothetical protein
MGFLGQMAGLKQEKELAEKRLAFEEKSQAQSQKQRKKELDFQKDAEKKQFGLEIAKLGITGLGSGAFEGIGSMFGFGDSAPTNVSGASISTGGMPVQAPTAKPSFMSTIGANVGQGLTGGLLGFGASSLMGGEGGGMGALIGAGAGMLPGLVSGIGGMFGGAGSFDFSKILSGGIGGALGGFATGLF